MQGMRKLTLLIALVALLSAVPVVAASVTDEEQKAYKAQVEPICKKNAEANATILKGVRQNVKNGKLKKASRQLLAAAKALKRTREQLLKVPKPAEDAALLTKWLKGVKTEAEMLEAAGRKLAKGEKNAAVRMVIRLETNAKQTNNLVLSYEFRYCRFNPGKFL